MKVLGIIVEYNPFHNGHLYHLQKAIEVTSADYIICVMSGNFVQRGEPSIINKWAKAEIALHYGIDLVIELPFVHSMASAEYFSMNAIKILNSIGIVDCICFGSESGNIESLDLIASVLTEENSDFSRILKKYLAKGLSFPQARQKALNDFFTEYSDLNISDEINTPNNILGIEYLKALKRLKSSIRPYTIKRAVNDYNNNQLTGNLSSATSIRNIINDKSLATEDILSKIKSNLPEKSYEVVKKELINGRSPVNVDSFSDIIISLIRRYSNNELKNIPYISEGLENKFKKNADTLANVHDVIMNTKSKRYTHSRIQRTIFNILVGLNYDDFNALNDLSSSTYARVLGFNDKGMKLLLRAKNRTTIPITPKFSILYNSCNPVIQKIAHYEKLADDLYVLAYKNPDDKKSNQDFTNKFIRLSITKK